jgi:protein phosphatase
MEAAGGLTADEAQRHPNRNVLTRAVGSFDRVRIDVTEIPWNSHSRLLLCTDGLTAVLSDEDIFRSARRLSGYELIDTLIQEALVRGGPDNITVIVAEDGTEWGGIDGR